MRLRTRVARATLATTTGLALAATALVAVPSTAHAAAITSGIVGAQRFLSEVGPAACTVANPSSSTSGPFTSNGTTVTQTASGTATLVDTGDAGDTMSVNHSSTTRIRATEAGGQLRTVALDLVVDIAVTAAQGVGTDCDVQLSTAGQFQYQTVLSTARWVTIEAELPAGAVVQLVFQRNVPITPAFNETIFMVGNAKGRAKADFFLPAGTYSSGGGLQHQFSSPTVAGDPTTVDVEANLDVAFSDPGTAINDAAGTGTQYAKFKNARDCATDRLKGKFRKAAGTKEKPALKKAIFRINGAKSKVVKSPKKGGKITLKNLPSDEDVKLTATFKLVGGGSETFTRDYRSCT
jgi:hypothetical protein